MCGIGHKNHPLTAIQVLSDVVESVLGAIYVSDNFSPEGVETFFDQVLKPFFDKHITLKTLSHHPTKILFELFQSRGCQEFEIIKQTDPENPGVVTCDGKRCSHCLAPH